MKLLLETRETRKYMKFKKAGLLPPSEQKTATEGEENNPTQKRRPNSPTTQNTGSPISASLRAQQKFQQITLQ